jgi:hypothetical protein
LLLSKMNYRFLRISSRMVTRSNAMANAVSLYDAHEHMSEIGQEWSNSQTHPEQAKR